MSLRGPLRQLALCATLLVACNDGPTGPDVGRLEISIIGLPVGTAAAVTIEGPDGFVATVTENVSLGALPSGSYIISIAPATAPSADVFAAANPVDTLRVSRGRRTAVAVTYELASGSIAFTSAGLPGGLSGEALLDGPGDETRTVAIPGVARGLIAGEWVLSYPRRFNTDGHGYDGPSGETIVVSASLTAIARNAGYLLATGAINATFNGLPDSVAPVGIVFGPFGIVTTLNASGERTGLNPGQYTVAPQNVFDGDVRYSASSVTHNVSAGLVPRAYDINYIARTGRLTLNATGLPDGVRSSARVRGPGGLDTTLVVGDTLKSISTGSYTVEGRLIEDGGTIYTSAALALVPVLGAQTAVATLAYTAGGDFDISVDAAYAVQTVQRYTGTVPLVAGRDALVRVFAKASAPNAFSASVRIRVLNGAVTSFEQIVPANSVGVPTTTNEGTFQGSWRVAVPGAAIQPGAQLQVTIDPDEALPDDDRLNNTLNKALEVRALPVFRGRFVPIRFASGGNAGNVNISNVATFLQLTRDMMPVGEVDVDLRAEYVTNQPRLTTSSGSVWEAVLGEIQTLRVIEASQRYYMGIVPVGYTSGIAGIGYFGVPSSVTWDYLPSGSEVLAHELGHNFDRRHAPCGGPAGIDPLYPHPGADIGSYGWDARLNRLRNPSSKDIMSYCSDPWVSAYTWEGVMGFRQATEPLSTVMAAPQSVILLRGRITPNGVHLDPSFTLDAAPVLPQEGPHRLELRDASGAVIYSASFRGMQVTHAEREGTEHFTFAVPIAALGGRSLAALSVSSGIHRGELRSSSQAALRVGTQLSAIRAGDGSLRVSDSDPGTVGMIIRDAATGRVISIVSGREITLPSSVGEIDVLTSDGLRSTTLRIKPPSR